MGRQSRRKHASKPTDYGRLFARAMRAEEAADCRRAEALIQDRETLRSHVVAMLKTWRAHFEGRRPPSTILSLQRSVSLLIEADELPLAHSILMLTDLKARGLDVEASNSLTLVALLSSAMRAGDCPNP